MRYSNTNLVWIGVFTVTALWSLSALVVGPGKSPEKVPVVEEPKLEAVPSRRVPSAGSLNQQSSQRREIPDPGEAPDFSLEEILKNE